MLKRWLNKILFAFLPPPHHYILLPILCLVYYPPFVSPNRSAEEFNPASTSAGWGSPFECPHPDINVTGRLSRGLRGAEWCGVAPEGKHGRVRKKSFRNKEKNGTGHVRVRRRVGTRSASRALRHSTFEHPANILGLSSMTKKKSGLVIIQTRRAVWAELTPLQQRKGCRD